MSRLGTQSEIDKLAATLELAPSDLDFLVDVAPQELRNLRIAIYERLFEQDRALFERLAVLASHLPPGVAARMAERRMGAMITARVAAEMAPLRVAQIAMRVTVAFFADVCAYLDPRRTREAIMRIAPDRVVDIALELVRREDFQTISRFVDHVTDEQTRAVVDAITDEGAILRVAFYMGSKNRMDHLFQTLPRERLERLVQRVERQRDDLLPAFLSVLIHVSYGIKRRLANLVAAQAEAVVEGYVCATQSQGLWADVLPVVAVMSPAAQRKVANLEALSRREVQESIVQTADDHRLWGVVLPLVAMMDSSGRDTVAAVLGARGVTTLERACDAALLGEHWELLFDLLRRMPEAKQRELAEIVHRLFGHVDPELLDRLTRRAAQLGIDQLGSFSRTGASASSAYS